MNVDKRRQQIIQYISEHDIASVAALIEAMNESPATIRRDLHFLETNGIISRSHGYAKYIQPSIVSNIPVTDMQTSVAIAAAALIPNNTTLILDSGVSAVALAQQLAERADLEIITNSISVANHLSFGRPSVSMTSGHLSGRQEALIGPDAQEYIKRLHVPYAFITTTGVRPSYGLVCTTPEQANIKHAMIKAADKVIVLADSEKTERDSIRVFATFDEIDVFITDSRPKNENLIHELAVHGVELIIANE